jgi:hypothetical protein
MLRLLAGVWLAPLLLGAGRDTVVFDTDSGMFGDDGAALVMLLRSSTQVLVPAITVVSGNVWVPQGVEYTLHILDLLKRSSPPVFAGAEVPLLHTADMAKESDARLAGGKAGPLEGIPLAIKDMFCTAGVRSTACSHILDSFVPTYESTVTSQLWRDGAVLLGKTNCDEFAMGSSNETSHCGPVHSPWRRKSSMPSSRSRSSPCGRTSICLLWISFPSVGLRQRPSRWLWHLRSPHYRCRLHHRHATNLILFHDPATLLDRDVGRHGHAWFAHIVADS